MPSREEIREGAILDLIEYKGFHRAPTEYIIDRVLSYLHSQGVAIRVDRELPYYCVCEDVYKPITMPQPAEKDFSHSNECFLYNKGFKAGYVAVESLIKEPDGNQDKK